MKLTKAQKKIVKKIKNEKYTIEFLERFYNERPESISRCFSYTLALLKITEANAFMTAINGIIARRRQG